MLETPDRRIQSVEAGRLYERSVNGDVARLYVLEIHGSTATCRRDGTVITVQTRTIRKHWREVYEKGFWPDLRDVVNSM